MCSKRKKPGENPRAVGWCAADGDDGSPRAGNGGWVCIPYAACASVPWVVCPGVGYGHGRGRGVHRGHGRGHGVHGIHGGGYMNLGYPEVNNGYLRPITGN